MIARPSSSGVRRHARGCSWSIVESSFLCKEMLGFSVINERKGQHGGKLVGTIN